MTFLFNDMEGAPKLSDAALANLQCHTLRSTHRLRSTQLFHRFKTPEALHTWLRTVTQVSNAKDQQEVDGAIKTVLFTHAGLSLLGVDASLLSRLDPAFQRGARHQRTIAKLVDAPPVTWEEVHKAPWHAVELLAHDGGVNAGTIKPTSAEHQLHIESGAAFGADGKELNDRAGRRFSHFGIADAGRDPVYTQEDYESLYEKPYDIRRDHVWKWDPRHALSTLLVPDPLAKEPGQFGSYFVYRKYTQNVREFIRRLGEIAKAVSDRMKEREKGGSRRMLPAERGYTLLKNFTQEHYDAFVQVATRPEVTLQQVLEEPMAIALVEFIFGLKPDGETTAQGRHPDFNYDNDPNGRTCPFNAHARKMVPRAQTRDVALERRVTVARRSSSYRKDRETGLLFWCAQASIGDQFEYIHERWANSLNVNPDHKPTPGFDTVIGQLTPATRKTYDGWMDSTEIHVSIWEAVRHVASEYLYAPSLDALKILGAPLGDSQ